MACTSPLFRIDARKEYFDDLPPHLRKRVRNYSVFLRPGEREALINKYHFNADYIQDIPCGQCLSCRLNSSRLWAIRCMLEAQYHEFNYFVTLTYDDFHLPSNEEGYVDFSGEVFETTLCRSDVVNFIKRLREYERSNFGNTGIKVFYCGEYGDLTSRPHYHLLLFGMTELKDAYLWRVSGDIKAYRSETLERLWSDDSAGFISPIGFVEFSEVTFDSAAYTARYVMKKQKGLMKKDFLEYYKTLSDPVPLREQPFVGMSRRPGIGYEYFKDHSDSMYVSDSVVYQKNFETFCSKPPRYFDRLYDVDEPEAMQAVRERREALALAAAHTKSILSDEDKMHRLDRESAIAEAKEMRRKKGVI